MLPITKKRIVVGIGIAVAVVVMPVLFMSLVGFVLTRLDGQTHFENDTNGPVTFSLFSYQSYERTKGEVTGPFTLADGETLDLWEPYPACVHFPTTGTAHVVSWSVREATKDEEPRFSLAALQTANTCTLGIAVWDPKTVYSCESQGKASTCVQTAE